MTAGRNAAARRRKALSLADKMISYKMQRKRSAAETYTRTAVRLEVADKIDGADCTEALYTQ